MTKHSMVGHFRIIRKRAAQAASLSINTSHTLLCTNETTSTGSRGGEGYSPDTNQGTPGTRLDQSRTLRAQNMSNNISQKQYLHGQKPEEGIETAMSSESWSSLMRYQTYKNMAAEEVPDGNWNDKAAPKTTKPEGNLRLAELNIPLTSSGIQCSQPKQ